MYECILYMYYYIILIYILKTKLNINLCFILYFDIYIDLCFLCIYNTIYREGLCLCIKQYLYAVVKIYNFNKIMHKKLNLCIYLTLNSSFK